MQPEHAEEEGAEGVEHLDEEVPPEAGVWREVRKLEMSEVDRRDEGPAWKQDAGEAE